MDIDYIPLSKAKPYKPAEKALLEFCKTLPPNKLAPKKSIAEIVGISERHISSLANSKTLIPYFITVLYDTRRVLCAGHPATIKKIKKENQQ